MRDRHKGFKKMKTSFGVIVAVAFALSAVAAQAQTATPAPAAPKAAAAKTPAKAKDAPMAGEYTTESDAKSHCSSDTVVWVNPKSKVYHFAGTSPYGKTKRGGYMCEKAAGGAGFHAAKGEKHP